MTIGLKRLEKEPRRRYASARELAQELGRFLEVRAIEARPVHPAAKLWWWCKRKPALATLAVALHLVGLVGMVGILWQWRRAEWQAATGQPMTGWLRHRDRTSSATLCWINWIESCPATISLTPTK